ncbi:hypothetical protein ACIO1C_02150 [Streptomyces sp. NPDC087420]|uniref:hypothetical protein n=1 Tax=Streptomyces sp. NPDC087420 TaxID=3365785 RepID=UPI003838AFEC
MVAEHVEQAEDPGAALAAIRILGADTFAPVLLTGEALAPQDAEAVALSLTALPPSRDVAPAPPAGPEGPWLMAWRDWGTATVLALLTDGGTGVPPTVPAPLPPPGPPQGEPAGSGTGAEGWPGWSVRMGQLSTLALPGLDGPIHDAARAAPLALARGATRAVLRRDYPTAARIARWLAWLHTDGVPLALDPAPLVEHIEVMAGGDRLALDTAIARRLITS